MEMGAFDISFSTSTNIFFNLILTTMSKISKLVSALAGQAYKEAKAIYDDILSSGSEKEKQDAKYIMKTM